MEPLPTIYEKDRCSEYITGRLTPSAKILFNAVSKARGDSSVSATVRFMVDEFLAKYVTERSGE